MKVAIVLPDLRHGGVERTRLLLAEHFLARGIDVDFVLFQKRGDLLGLVPPRANIVDLSARRLRDGFLPLVAYLRTSRPDALLAGMWPLTGMAGLTKLVSGVDCRVVVSEHSHLTSSDAVKGLSDVAHRSLGAFLYGNADEVVAVSDGVKRDLMDRTGLASRRVRVIHNPVRPMNPAVRPDRELMDWWQGAPHQVLAVGTLKAAKDYPTLISAFAKVRQGIDARLLVLGEGPLRAELEALIARLSLSEAVRLPGFVPEPQVYLPAGDLFVLSSAWEGFGNVIVEALAAGVPVVATDCPSGPSEILQGGRYGRLAPVGDVDGLAEAMLTTLAQPPSSDLLRRRAADFSVERAVGQYLDALFQGRIAGSERTAA